MAATVENSRVSLDTFLRGNLLLIIDEANPRNAGDTVRFRGIGVVGLAGLVVRNVIKTNLVVVTRGKAMDGKAPANIGGLRTELRDLPDVGTE